MDPLQVLEQRREHIEAHRHAAGEPQRPAQRARVIGDRADRVADVLEHALSELDQALGGRRHPHLPADAQEQRLAQFLLEQRDLPADGRLRHVQLPCRMAVNDPVSAIAWRISSWRRSMTQYCRIAVR